MLKRGPPVGHIDSSDISAAGLKKQRTNETWSGETHLSPPGGSSLNLSHPQQTDPLSSSGAEITHPPVRNPSCKPSQILRAALSVGKYNEMRSAILRHQELFLGQLYDLHHTVQLQRHLVSICSQREAMHAELIKLEAEQRAHRNAISDVTVEQEEDTVNMTASTLRQGSTAGLGWQPSQLPPPQRGATAASSKHLPEQQAGSASSKQHPVSEPPRPSQAPTAGFSNPTQAGTDAQGMQAGQAGVDMSQQGVWPGMFPRGYPLQYSQAGMGMGGFNGWGMPMMGGFGNPYGMPFGMMAPSMDPMMAWYAMHYGQYAHAMQNQANAANAANARRQAQADQEGAAAAVANEAGKVADEDDAAARQNLRWWQDPEKVFGIAANPAIVGNTPSNLRLKGAKKDELQTEVTSKPPERQKSKATNKAAAEDPKSLSNPTKTSTKAGASAGSEPIGSHQKAGSGLSAFKKLPTRSPNVRRPPTRAESIGSEVSRSAAERSPADEGESSGVDHTAAQRQ